jgi:outer membrane murein-binding lipoprotein Lpp
MATNSRYVSRLAATCVVVLAIAGCSSSSPGPDEAKSGDGGTPNAAAQTLPSDPRQFVAAAMKAHSSEAALAQARLGRTKKRSTLYKDKTTYATQTETCLYQLPDRLFRMVELEANGKKGTLVFVYRGQEGWLNKDGAVVERPPRENEVSRVYPVGLLNGLRDLLEPKNSLAYIRSAANDQDKEVGIRVTGAENADYFFDKQRKLLVRVVTTRTDPVAKSSGTAEVRFSNFREMHGFTIAFSGQGYHDGTLREEWTLDEFNVLRHIDDKVFSKPEGE